MLVPRPENLDTRYGDFVEHDMYSIAQRVREVDKSLRIAFHPGRDEPYTIMERGSDGVDRFVFRTAELDGRIIEKLHYLLNVPFEKRFAEVQRLEAKNKQEYAQYERDKMYAEIGEPMLPALVKAGAIDSRPQSFPKRGVKAK